MTQCNRRTITIGLIGSFIALVNLILIYHFHPTFNEFPSTQPLPPPPRPAPPPLEPPKHYGIPLVRPPQHERKFVSTAVDDFIKNVSMAFQDPDLAILLQNCLPNTLDTTIEWYRLRDDPRTFLITGDIPAMWIRDSTNQILPYLSMASLDRRLQDLILGVLVVQASYLHYDPYANAFLRPWYAPNFRFRDGRTDQVVPHYDPNLVWESKYELDSLAHFLELANEYMTVTGDIERVVRSEDWVKALPRVFQVIRHQMRGSWEEPVLSSVEWPLHHRPPVTYLGGNRSYIETPEPLPVNNGYRFKRFTDRPTETLGENGIGGISRQCGLVRSAFRPSDDATTFPYLIPANAQLTVNLGRLAKHLQDAFKKFNDLAPELKDIAREAETLSDTIRKAIYEHAVVEHPRFGKIFAYEVDCYGSQLLMDDANTPSLLSLPILGFVDTQDTVYQNTRAFVLSQNNPWYFEGAFAQGVGSPHTGRDMIWPMSLLMQIQTSTSENEIRLLLETLKRLSSKTGLMCESFHKDQPARFTRPWFSWANGLAGSTLISVFQRFPHLV
ncbi:uncharacterized protein BYT42DRAFT_554546 [Radiomyces spectabilis]|uniref:uncharacterized protein n=1 Tax=Radiomyces spectabilis TaxID=64574 RepID=UPI002220347D|nr:uncharacterized protein BYT42DRAFT_554546 [Radiomyces spectabilis]KAI8390851.1 hypothetical protein BYT42DRAFT_554546 [Radiomyces spectabilis]